MKTCLQKHFGDELLITFADGKPNIVKFRKTAAAILNAFHEMEKTAIDVEADKLNVSKKTVELIKSDIKLVKATSETYPQLKLRLDSTLIFFSIRFKCSCRVFWPLRIS